MRGLEYLPELEEGSGVRGLGEVLGWSSVSRLWRRGVIGGGDGVDKEEGRIGWWG